MTSYIPFNKENKYYLILVDDTTSHLALSKAIEVFHTDCDGEFVLTVMGSVCQMTRGPFFRLLEPATTSPIWALAKWGHQPQAASPYTQGCLLLPFSLSPHIGRSCFDCKYLINSTPSEVIVGNSPFGRPYTQPLALICVFVCTCFVLPRFERTKLTAR